MQKKDLDISFADGGEAELHLAVELYGYPLLRYCHNILCDYADAQDAVQITFIKANHKRNSFKRGTSLSAWLYQIAYRSCIDILRKRRLRQLILPPKVNDTHNLIGDELKEALMALSPLERGLVFNRVIGEKSYAELEEIYQLSAVVLRKRYERARKKLAKRLKETHPYYSRLEEKS